MNTQRRIFRGRGGPTDGRLPKHNARRRRQKQATKPTENKYGDAPPVLEEEDEDGSSLEIVVAAAPVSAPIQSTLDEPWREEIKHLQKRLRNVQENIQTSEGISNPRTYKENVLNAIANCISEWRAILKHYQVEEAPEIEEDVMEYDTPQAHDESEQEESDSEEDVETASASIAANPPTTTIDPDITKETALQVYMLLQFSVQCGPMAGGKPGYFKRCGGTVARMVADYLNQVVPTAQDCSNLQFSAKQADAIESWRNNANKAALQDKEPSKSALKKQSGKSKKKKLKK